MSFFEAVIGWLAPPVCVGCEAEGDALCEACRFSSIVPFGERCYRCNRLSDRSRTCTACRKDSPRHVWVASDYEGLVKELIIKYKFGHLRAANQALSFEMIETLRKYNSIADINEYLIIPVPTASHRIRERGFDHAALLSKQLARSLGLNHSRALHRRGQSRQVGSSRSIRMNQPKDIYYVNDPPRIAGQKILLIDDVVTTGATIRSATKALKSAGAKAVDALIFAKKI